MTIRTEGAAVVLELAGTLDAPLASALVDAVEAALAGTPERIEIDLCELHGWTAEGARALVRCRELCRDLPGGLHYRAGRGAGREALLSAYA